MTPFSPASPQHLEHFLLEEDHPFAEKEQLLWEYQVAHNPVIRQFCEELTSASDHPISRSASISIPIEFFKYRAMQCGIWEAETIFESSGTSGQQPSRHLVRNLALYEHNTIRGFHEFFPPQPYRILALLPSYLERTSSSLVHMVKTWIDAFGLPGSGFYLTDRERLRANLQEAIQAGERILLIGVAFALLDFVEEGVIQLPPDAIVIETGGMKGRKKEIIREELHAYLRKGFGLPQIYSEYGMTELMSQAYTQTNGRFRPASTLKVYVSDIHLNRLIQPPGVAGRIHLVDLANVHSCAFIATDDLGRMYEDGSFEVIGRIDTAELRGCSLMYV